MSKDKSKKDNLKLLIKKKKKQEQRDWRLTMKRLRKFQSDVLKDKASRYD
jgi:hypothetical protein